MGIVPCFLALAVLAPAGRSTVEDGRVIFFVGGSPAHGLHLHIDEQVRDAAASPPRVRFVMRSQIAVGLSRGFGIAGDGSIERPWTLLLPGRALGLMLQFGAAPDYWAIRPDPGSPGTAGN